MLLRRETLLKCAPFLVLAFLLLLFPVFEMLGDWNRGREHAYLLDSRFLSFRNMARILRDAAPMLMVATGVTFIILMGSIDLSMEGSVSVCAVLFGFVFIALGGTLASWGWLAIPFTLGVGLLIGLLNGLVHIRLRIPSFMASLAMGFVATGFALMLSGGDRIRVEDPLFRMLLTERWLGLPMMVYAAGLLILLGWFIQSHTVLGRNFYAIGGGEELAQASGMHVDRVRLAGFTLAGAFYALGAMLAIAKIAIAETATGNNFMFLSIASVVVGGTALWGGIGGVWNTLVGVLIVFVIGNGMLVIGLPDYLQDGVLGVLVIIAVVLSTNRRALSFVK